MNDLVFITVCSHDFPHPLNFCQILSASVKVNAYNMELLELTILKNTSSTFFVNGDAYILPYCLHTYLGLNSNGSPY